MDLFSQKIIKGAFWQSGFRFAFLVVLISVLSTVLIVDQFIWQGVITAKYFWFVVAMCCAVGCWCVALLSGRGRVGKLFLADIGVGLLAIYVCSSYLLLNREPLMHRWLFLLMIPLYAMVRTSCTDRQLKRFIVDAILVVVLVEAVWGLLQLYGYTHSYHGLYKITGSFFNPGPYSGFVAVGVPLALAYVLDKALLAWERWLGGTTLIAALLVLPAAMSRAAWLATIAGSALVLWNIYGVSYFKSRFGKTGRRIVVIASCAVVAGLLTGMYYLKKDSADGRWLIWQVSAEIVKESPLFGTGFGRFAAEYGNAQAGVFLSGKGSELQSMVADSPEYAFNEYVQMTVELGLVGLTLFVAIIICIFRTDQKTKPAKEKYALLTFLVFAAFSYPFSVLPLGILFVFLLAASASSSRTLSFSLPVWLRITGMTACLCITAYGANQILPKRTAYREWPSLQMLYNAGAYKESVREYKTWYPSLQHEKLFLFEYGQCLSKTGQYTESNHIFEQYLRYGSDPMVYNCMGNNYKAMGEHRNAENAYIHASQVVPNRHYPLYLLMKFYMETGQDEKAKETAKTLLDKPVKVQSTAIREMQQEAKQLTLE